MHLALCEVESYAPHWTYSPAFSISLCLFIEKFFFYFWISSQFFFCLRCLLLMQLHNKFFSELSVIMNSDMNILLTLFWPSSCVPVFIIGRELIGAGCCSTHLQWLESTRVFGCGAPRRCALCRLWLMAVSWVQIYPHTTPCSFFMS